MKTKISFLILILIVALMSTGIFYKETFNRENPDSSGPIVIRISHVASEDTAAHLAYIDFEKELEEMSNGRFDVQVFPNGVLGGDRQNVEAVSIGSLTATTPGSAVLAGFEPRFMVADLPFIFTSRESAYKAFDNELGDALNNTLEKHNLMNYGFTETGFRYITNNEKPIYKPDDLKGLKIRTMENPMHMQSFREWGANPTPISFSELFTALQQGTVDGQENPAQIIYSSRFFEAQKYMSLTGHFFASGSILFNKTFVENLPEDLREMLEICAENFKVKNRNLIISMEADFIKKIEEAGMEVNELTAEQKQVFADIAKPVYDTFRQQYGDELINYATKYND